MKNNFLKKLFLNSSVNGINKMSLLNFCSKVKMPIQTTKSETKAFAIIGSGPAGFHIARDLLKKYKDNVRLDIFDKSPLPYGLVRAGIAPDHQGMKNAINEYRKCLEDKRVNLFCNVEIIDTDIKENNSNTNTNTSNKEIIVKIPISKLLSNYSGVVLCCGAEDETTLKLPCVKKNCNSNDVKDTNNLDSRNNHNQEQINVDSTNMKQFSNYFTSREVVAWYNADYKESLLNRINQIDFSNIKSVLIIGNGNVAIDLARILSKSTEELKKYDIPDHVIEKLSKSNIEKIVIVGRRGAVQSAFTRIEINELRESGDIYVFEDEIIQSKNDSSMEEIKQNKPLKNKFDLITGEKINTINKDTIHKDNIINNNGSTVLSNDVSKKKKPKIYLRYLLAPSKLVVEQNNLDNTSVNRNNNFKDNNNTEFKLKGIVFNKTILKGEAFNQFAEVDKSSQEIINADLTILSIGYKVGPIFKNTFKTDDKTGLVENTTGVLKDVKGNSMNNVYACGWFKRGPKGILNATIMDASEVFSSIKKNYDDLKTVKELSQATTTDLESKSQSLYISTANSDNDENNFLIDYSCLFNKEQLNSLLTKEECIWLLEQEKENGKKKKKVADKFISRSEIFEKIKKMSSF